MAFRKPQKGASLMLAFRPDKTIIIGANKLAATRAFAALEAGSRVAILARTFLTAACEELRRLVEEEDDKVEVCDLEEFNPSSSYTGSNHDYDALDLASLESFLDAQGPGSITLAFIADTLITFDPSKRRSGASAKQLYDACRKRNIPVNVTDIPELCDFTVCSSHRFTTENRDGGVATPLQVGVTTNGQGCRLASRIRREIVAKLPRDVGAAVQKVGELRELAKFDGRTAKSDSILEDVEDVEHELNEELTVPSPNRPVIQRSKKRHFSEGESEAQSARRRMKWVAQISEYWSFKQLASLKEEDMRNLLSGDLLSSKPPNPSSFSPIPDSGSFSSQHELNVSPSPKSGRVLLIGSGPGHPSLLTLAAHQALTSLAGLVLADKLIPSAVLSLIPSHIPLHIARKFPGNAEGAQQELMDMALVAAREGKTIVRLKQGDPAMYGRVGEEILFLRKHGVECVVVPGISSSLAAPLFAGIPVTQRGAADSLAVATGVGRGGEKARLPGYERARTLVLMMGNARLESLVNTLISGDDGSFEPYPPNVPTAIIERASMPDQRVITAPLSDILFALESVGEQRPPGLLVVGWAVLSLWGEGDMTILDDAPEKSSSAETEEKDRERIEKWLDGWRWRVCEGLDELWDIFKVPIKEGEQRR